MARMNSGFRSGSDGDRLIGTILIDSGRLSAEDAQRIVEFQQKSGLRFGEAGIKLGVLVEQDVHFALSVQFDYPYISSTARPVTDDVVVAYRPFGREGERLRALRSQLQMRWLEERNRNASLAVVSAHRGEGRSYLAANLAVTFAQAGERTLLVDADLRHPSLHRLFKLDNSIGLSNLLIGQTLDGLVKFVPGIPGLAVLPSGPTPPNAQELLSRPALRRIVEQSLSTFNVVIIDTPASDECIDGTLVAQAAGSALMVARRNMTRVASLVDTVEALRQSGVAVVGSVLVDLPVKRALRRKQPEPA